VREFHPRNDDLSVPKYLKGLRDPDPLLYSPLVALNNVVGKTFRRPNSETYQIAPVQ
jgi:hypothetical protein